MINILSFYRKKRNKFFLLIILLFSIFNSFIYYKYENINHYAVQDEEIYLIVDKDLYNEINSKYKLKISEISEIELYNYNIDNDDNYYKIHFNKMSLYEKYKEKAQVFTTNQFYDNTLSTMKFYKLIISVILSLSFIILITTIYLIIHYEKSNINLLKVLGYNHSKIIIIYSINMIILLLPSILIYLITLILLS